MPRRKNGKHDPSIVWPPEGRQDPIGGWPPQSYELNNPDWPPRYHHNLMHWEINFCHTAHCASCGKKIRTYSFQCSNCKNRHCPDCLTREEDGKNSVWLSMMRYGCWCIYRRKLPNGHIISGGADEVWLAMNAWRHPKERFGRPVTPEPIDVSVEFDPYEQLEVETYEEVNHNATVIVGAGIIGLCIAHALGCKIKKSGTRHKIVVVDINDDICKDASGSCLGLLTSHGMPELWKPIADAARHAWKKALNCEDGELAKAAGFHNDVQLHTVTEGEDGSFDLPSLSWFESATNQKDGCRDDYAFGRIDTAELVEWLRRDCEETLGVHFRFNSTATQLYQAHQGQHNFGMHVKICTFSEDSLKFSDSEVFKTTNLVLAAGPYTSQIFKDLRPSMSLELENHIQHRNVLEMSINPSLQEKDVTFHVTVPTEGELEPELTMLKRSDPATNEHKLLISASDAQIENKTLNHLKARGLDFSELDLSHFQNLASSYLNANTLAATSPTEARHYICTANNGNPIIDRVLLEEAPKTESVEGNLWVDQNIWLCYGFGNWGTFLAPAVGVQVARGILKEEEFFDGFDFELPCQTVVKKEGEGDGEEMGMDETGKGREVKIAAKVK